MNVHVQGHRPRVPDRVPVHNVVSCTAVVGVNDVCFVQADHQGPNWPDGHHVLEQARTDIVGLAQHAAAES